MIMRTLAKALLPWMLVNSESSQHGEMALKRSRCTVKAPCHKLLNYEEHNDRRDVILHRH